MHLFSKSIKTPKTKFHFEASLSENKVSISFSKGRYLARINTLLYAEGTWRISTLIVPTRLRNRGIGGKLLSRAIEISEA